MTRYAVLRVLDASKPQAGLPARDVTAFYIGGDTPHVWGDAEIAQYAKGGRLPIWVRSNPMGAAQGHDEGVLVRRWCEKRGVPAGCKIVLDLEVAIDPAYVTAFNMSVRPYACMKYGSGSTIFRNPSTDGGTWLADPTGVPHQDPRAALTQFMFAQAYDMSLGEPDPNHPYWGLANTGGNGTGGITAKETYMIISPKEIAVPVSWHAGTVHAIGFFSDYTNIGTDAPVMRVAVHSASKGYSQIQTVSYVHNTKPVVTFIENDVDGVSISRVDNGAAMVSADWQ